MLPTAAADFVHQTQGDEGDVENRSSRSERLPWKHWVGHYLVSIALLIVFVFFIFSILPKWTGVKPKTPPIDRDNCECDCFDGWMKGAYGSKGFKFLYFNAEPETLIIFAYVLVFFTLGQRVIERVLKLWHKGRLVKHVVAIFALSSIIPTWFSVWAEINYWNDRYHKLHRHQVFFTLTELMAAFCLSLFMDRKKQPRSMWPAWFLLAVGAIHSWQHFWDNMIVNLFQPQFSYYIPRDILLLSGDVAIALFGLHKVRSHLTKQRIIWLLVLCGATVLFLSTVTYAG